MMAGSVAEVERVDGRDPLPASKFDILGVPFLTLSLEALLSRLDTWIATRRPVYICAVCASSLIEASRDPEFLSALCAADLNLPDGAPVAWTLSRLSGVRQERLAGPSVMLRLLELASDRGYKVLLYGSTPGIQAAVVSRIARDYPRVVVAGTISPPFRSLTDDEDRGICRRIRESSADLVLVSLGAPKQEIWMRDHRETLAIPLFGVGAAFEFYVGRIRRAPLWMQRAGLEWSYRLLQQPRRVGRRFATTLPVFAWRVARQLVRESWGRGVPRGGRR
jgi:N-acetylglucosaminyldiphosphoundecaprenol N-acetyl-beta-D-mannosaminyltransferase